MPSYKKELNWPEVWSLADRLKSELLFEGVKSKVCGSLRRKCQVIYDVDMVVMADAVTTAKAIVESCQRISYEIDNWLEPKLMSKLKLESKSFDFIIGGIQFNFMVTTPECWGAAIMHLTGSMKFNTMMRGRAKKLGYKLNQYGLFHGEEQIAGKHEGVIFKALMVEPLTPRQRSTDTCYLKFEETKEGEHISTVETMASADLNKCRELYQKLGCQGCVWAGQHGKCTIQTPHLTIYEGIDRCLTRRQAGVKQL